MDRRRNRGPRLLTASGLLCPDRFLLTPRARIIFMILFLPAVFPLPLGAQTPGTGPRILVETGSGIPAAGDRWILTLLVDHSPGEVEIRPPRFPDALIPEETRRESRFIENERWTAAEYRFILKGPGTVTIPAFEVITPLGRGQSSPFILTIRSSGGGRGEFHPRLEWEPVPPGLTAGELFEVGLRLVDWDPRRPFPGAALFFPQVPEGVILEAEDPGLEAGKRGQVLRLRIIPLSGPRFILPGRTIRYEGFLLEIPPLRIPVRESAVPPVPEHTPSPVPLPPVFPAEPVAPGAPGFSEINFGVLSGSVPGRLFRPAFEEAVARVQTLWEAGDRARALAELRRFEREQPAGPLVKALRRDMENALKLEYTEDEKWRPRGLFLPGFLGALALLITGAVIRFFRPSGSRFSVFFGIILLGFAGICLWGFVTGRGIPPGKSSGVLRETAARRVPDPSGAVTAFFREGQRVSIRPDGGSWVWVEAPDAAAGAGWVPRSDVIFY